MKRYTKQEEEILTQITDHCQNTCPNCLNCVEKDCVLFRIEEIITKAKEEKK